MYKMVFSATGRTMKVADAFCSAWENVADVDLSCTDFRRPQLKSEDLCLIAVPVYGGRVPAPAAENITKIQANGAKSVLMAVYGNRAYDDCLAELKDLCAKAGFVPVAAVAALAQHSLITTVAADRPDTDDVNQLFEWGRKIAAYHAEGTLPHDVIVPGNIPEKRRGAMPVHPKADKNCIKCGLCAEKCPVKAIPTTDPSQTDAALCITCMRCVEICPVNSRTLMPGVMKIAGPVMKKVWGKHLQNELFFEEKQ